MIVLDYTDRRPLYEQVVARFKEQILAGIIEPDEQLPSVRQLAVELSINPNTIQRAYSEMEKQGMIYCVKGRGNFVAQIKPLQDKKKEELIETIVKAISELENMGVPKKEVLNILNERNTNEK